MGGLRSGNWMVEESTIISFPLHLSFTFSSQLYQRGLLPILIHFLPLSPPPHFHSLPFFVLIYSFSLLSTTSLRCFKLSHWVHSKLKIVFAESGTQEKVQNTHTNMSTDNGHHTLHTIKFPPRVSPILRQVWR